MKSALAVFAGIVATVVLSLGCDAGMFAAGLFGPSATDGAFAIAAVYRAVFNGVGGWVTARLAPSSPMRHAMALAGFGVVAGSLGVVAAAAGGEEMGPLWYAVSIPVSAIPTVWLGATVHTRRSS
ncbi:MAG: hypothetical protein ABMA64_23320 [Myxococcota bacterium]